METQFIDLVAAFNLNEIKKIRIEDIPKDDLDEAFVYSCMFREGYEIVKYFLPFVSEDTKGKGRVEANYYKLTETLKLF